MNRRERRRAEAQQHHHEERMRKDTKEREAKTMGATTDKGFEQYRELFQRAYSKSSDREVGEGWMRGEAAAASGVDGMFIHPTGEAPPTPRDNDPWARGRRRQFVGRRADERHLPYRRKQTVGDR